MGPTEIYPGSHHLFALQSWMGHYDRIRDAIRTSAPAGSIFITAYSIWHRRAASTATGTRNLLKYSYWRTVAPKRDWVAESDFDFSTTEYVPNGLPGQQFRDWYDAAAMFFWLCGDDRPLARLFLVKKAGQWVTHHPVRAPTHSRQKASKGFDHKKTRVS